MLTISKPISAPKASDYYRDHYTRGDYYTENATLPGAWHGQGAARLGLAGEVRAEDFQAALNGQHPHTGRVLVPPATGNETHRGAYDLTFSAPKSVSVMAVAGGDERITDAHRRSVRAALDALEEHAQARAHGGTERVTTGNLTTAVFVHTESRNLDPQLHSHAVVMNMTQRPDGEWRAVEPRTLYQHQRYGTAVYRSELAHELQRHGYELRAGRDGQPEIAGVTRETIQEFSTRRAEIEAAVAQRGVLDADAKQQAAHATREPKSPEIDRARLAAEWQERARATGTDLAAVRDAAQQRGPIERDAGDRQARAEAAVSFAVEHEFERRAVVDQARLESTALAHDPAGVTLADVRQEIERRGAAGTLLAAGEARYTTPEMVRVEQAIVKRVQQGQGQMAPLDAQSQARTDWNHLNVEQQLAVKHILESRDAVLGIDGRAGTGKTDALRAVREEVEARGADVRGYAVTTGARDRLAETGVRAETVEHAIQSHAPGPGGPRQLWIVDEASLLSTRQTHALLARAEDARAQVVFVGDSRQHRSIEAGDAFRQMQERGGLATAQLDRIHRQADPGFRETVTHAADGRAADAIRQLDQRGHVREVPDRDARLTRVAHAYQEFNARMPQDTTLVIAPANADRQAINAQVHSLRQAAGQVERTEYPATALTSRNLSQAERKTAAAYQPGDYVVYARGSRALGVERETPARVVDRDAARNSVTVEQDGRTTTYDPRRLHGAEVYRAEARGYAVGDQVQFRRADHTQHIANGTRGEVTALDHHNGQAQVRLHDGRMVTVNLSRPQPIEYGYAVTSHSAQGQTVDRVILHVDTRHSAELVNERQTYVSLSRAKYGAEVYTDDKAQLPRAASRPQERETALNARERAETAARGSHTKETRPEPERDPGRRGPRREESGAGRTKGETDAQALARQMQEEQHRRDLQQHTGGDTGMGRGR